MSRRAVLASVLLLAACTLPETIQNLEREDPPPELGRPGFVRMAARTGAWAGGLVGGVGSVLLLPITYPVSLLAECPLGYSKTEFRWGVASMGASAGHWLLGAPLDVFHYVFWRAWVNQSCEPASYDYVPMKPPLGPGAAVAAPKQ